MLPVSPGRALSSALISCVILGVSGYRWALACEERAVVCAFLSDYPWLVPSVCQHQLRRSISIVLMFAIDFPGLSPLGQVLVQLRIV